MKDMGLGLPPESSSEKTILRTSSSRRRRFGLPSLGLRVSERRLLLIILDLFFLSTSLTLSLLLRTNLLPGPYALWANVKWYVTLWLLWAVIASIFDVYDLNRSANYSTIGWSIGGAAFISSLFYLMIPWLTPPIENRSQGFVFVFLSITTLALWRILYARLFVQPVFLRRILIVGAGASGQSFVHALRQQEGRFETISTPYRGGIVLVGFVDDNPDYQGCDFGGVPVLGSNSQLESLVDEREIDEVVLAISDTQSIRPELFEAIMKCRERGIPFSTMTTMYERLFARVAYEHVSQNVELATGQEEGPFHRMANLAKRIIDIAGALLGFVFLLFLVPIVAFTNAIVSPGPLFFRQDRVAKGGNNFKLIKFRSMVPDAEKHSGAIWARPDDERITAAGRWLRKTHLDELPQVINVMMGEMSLVGPRPERPEFVAELSQTIPFYRARHSVKPGITGWAQIHQDYGDSLEGAKEKLSYDLYYIKRAGPILDTVIVLRTFAKILSFRGR